MKTLFQTLLVCLGITHSFVVGYTYGELCDAYSDILRYDCAMLNLLVEHFCLHLAGFILNYSRKQNSCSCRRVFGCTRDLDFRIVYSLDLHYFLV